MGAGSAAIAVAQLAGQLDEITRMVRFEPALLELRVDAVSHWSIGQQVDHVLKVLEAGQRFFGGSQEPPARLSSGMNLTGHLLLALGWIPRGVGKSPRGVLPADRTVDDLAERAARLRSFYCDTPLPEAVLADPTPVFPHPYFGGLTTLQGLRFLGLHTRHHLKIVADIRRAA